MHWSNHNICMVCNTNDSIDPVQSRVLALVSAREERVVVLTETILMAMVPAKWQRNMANRNTRRRKGIINRD